MKKLVNLACEIVNMCSDAIKNSSKNLKVIRVIDEEFKKQIYSLENFDKVIVLNKTREIGSCKLILDSAFFEYDSELFDKVYLFEKLCKKLSSKNITILYPNR